MDPENLYQKIAREIMAQIDGGLLLPGEKLPSVRHLVRERSVSPGTVLAAYRLLEDLGYLRPERGSGFYAMRPESRQSPPPDPGRTNLRPVRPTFDEALLSALNFENRPVHTPFGVAVPDESFLPVQLLQRAMGRVLRMEGIHNFSFPPGSQALRRQLALLYTHHGGAVAKLTPENFILTHGGSHCIWSTLRAITKPGDLILVESPAYAGFFPILNDLDLRLVELPVDPRSGPDLERLEQIIKKHNDLKAVLIVPSFQNPTGALLREEDRMEFLRLTVERGIHVIEDDIYGDIHHGPQRPTPLRLLDKTGLVHLCSSFSKTVSPALRLGWAIPGVCHEGVLREVHLTTLGHSRLIEETAVQLLESGGYERHLRRFRREISEQMLRISEMVRLHFPEETRIASPGGGFLLWIELPAPCDSLELQREALGRGITVSPGPIYSARRDYGNYIRLNCAVRPGERTMESLRILGMLAKRLS